MNANLALVQSARLGRIILTRSANPMTLQRQKLSSSVCSLSRYEPRDYTKLHQNYARFQIPDGKPVHLKGGIKDYCLLYTTVGLCVYGVGLMFYHFYHMAFPKAKEESKH